MPDDLPVLIAGAGPTGLAAALFLTRRGVPVRILDIAPEPTSTSKALGVNPRTLKLLEETGVTAAILAEAQPLQRLRLHRQGHELAVIAPDWTALGAGHPMAVLPQARTETLLAEALAALGVTVERGLGVDDVAQDDWGVGSRLTNGEHVRSQILFAADGAHSLIRKTFGLKFDGDAWDDPWELMDVDLTGPAPEEGWIDLRPGGPFVCLPSSGTTFRLIGFGPPLLDNLPDGWTAGEVHWRSAFKISHRMAETMQRGRVCLGGDAAHIHSPVGARGMNLGIEDAFVFADCAADFLSGQPGRLEDYGRLRHAVDSAVVRNVRALTSAVRAGGPTADWLRRALIPRIARMPFILNRGLKVGMGLDHPVRTR